MLCLAAARDMRITERRKVNALGITCLKVWCECHKWIKLVMKSWNRKAVGEWSGSSSIEIIWTLGEN